MEKQYRDATGYGVTPRECTLEAIFLETAFRFTHLFWYVSLDSCQKKVADYCCLTMENYSSSNEPGFFPCFGPFLLSLCIQFTGIDW